MPGLTEDHRMHVVLLVLTSCISVNAGIKYDAEKEERQLQEARQRELQRIEETKQKAAEKGAVNHLSSLWFYMETGNVVCNLCSCIQRIQRQRNRTHLWRNWLHRWSKTCRWRSPTYTSAMRMMWVLLTFTFSAVLQLGAFIYLQYTVCSFVFTSLYVLYYWVLWSLEDFLVCSVCIIT